MRFLKSYFKQPIVLITFLVLVAIVGFLLLSSVSGKKSYEVNTLSIDDMAKQAPEMTDEEAQMIKKNIKEMKEKGFAEVPDEVIPPEIDATAKGLKPLDKIKTTFETLMPSWLPAKASLLGGIPAGQESSERWDSITLVYETPQGQFHIGQAKPQNGGAIYPKELISEKINGQPAIVSALKGKKSKRLWTSIAWNSNDTEFVVEGELPIGVLKKVAESLQ